MVDALSVALGRSVLLDDPELTPLSYSREWDVDAVRSQGVLSRGVSPRVRQALLAQGIATAEEAVPTRRDPELGMEMRICMPVRCGERLLGYLWLLDPEPLGEKQLDTLREAARELAGHLASAAEQIGDDGQLIAALRSPDAAVRGAAVDQAARRGFPRGASVALCLLAAAVPGADPLSAATRTVRRLSVGYAIAGSSDEGSALVLSLEDPVVRPRRVAAIAEWVQDGAAEEVLIGQSGRATLHSVDQAWREARIALKVARRGYPKRKFASWGELGADRLVAQLPEAARENLPKPLAHLIEAEPELARTLETFLDRGGDVRRSAEELALHRSGLYYRLRRIEEVAELDLDDGDDRLLAHLALRARGLDGQEG